MRRTGTHLLGLSALLGGALALLAASPGPARADAGPRLDLVQSRARLHLLPAGGLLLPVADAGFFKYTQDYRRPFAEVLTRGGVQGRALRRSEVTLRFPWFDGAAAGVLRLRADGLVADQRVMLWLNGRRLGSVRLEEGWRTVDAPLGEGLLRQGENELRLRVARPRQLGAGRAWGLWHSVQVRVGSPPPPGAEAPPLLAPDARVRVGGVEQPALRGFERMLLLLEVPRDGQLTLRTGVTRGEARFGVSVKPLRGGEAQTLLDHPQPAGAWTPHRLSLLPWAGQLVRLQLSLQGDVGAAAWGSPQVRAALPEPGPRPALQNAILFVGDALRSDRLRAYTATAVRTPNLHAALRRGGAVFLHNQAASPSSPPSHASLQTGMIPRVHGVAGDKGKLKPGTPMLSTQLRAAGIRAAYFGNNSFGMARLRAPGQWHAFHQPVHEGKGADCQVLVQLMLDYARQRKEARERFFISALAYEPHVPYRYHAGITEHYFSGPFAPPIGKQVTGQVLERIVGGGLQMDARRWAQLKALYDGEVEYMDGCLGRLLEGLEGLGLLEQTAVVVTGDHGEGFYEHGKCGHAFSLNAELLEVPFVLLSAAVGAEPLRVDVVTSHLDLSATLLDLLGVDPDRRMQGASLVPLLRRQGRWTPRVVAAEYGRSYALRARSWKYLVGYQGEESRFFVRQDPLEQEDLQAREPAVLRYFRDLAGFYLAHRTAWRARTFGTLNNHRSGFPLREEAAPPDS